MGPRRSYPACNRVTAFGKIATFPLRGTLTGNRGIQRSGREIMRSYARDSSAIGALGRSLVR